MKRLQPGLIFLGFWALLVLGGRTNFFRDPGTFWHTVIGEKILTEGFVDRDPFTFTFRNDLWVPYQWLGEVVMALAHRLNGFDAQLAGATGLLAALFTVLTLRLTRTGLNPVAALMFVGVVLGASSTHFHVRPHLATMLGMALTMALIVEIEAGRKPWYAVAALVPVYLIWVNVHGGVLGGLTTLGLAGVGWTLFRLAGKPSPLPGARAVAGLLGLGLACGLVAFVNPYGVRLPQTWLLIMSMPHLPDIIVEHAPTDFASPGAWPLAALMAGYVVLLAGVPPARWRVSWLLPLFWMAQAYGRARHAPLFALSACVVAADLWPQTRWARLVERRRPDFYAAASPVTTTWRNRLESLALPALVVAVVVALQASHSPWGKWARLDPTLWPLEALPAMRAIEPAAGQRNHLFNDYSDGAFAIYFTPGYEVFVDDRCELFGDAWLVEFTAACEADPPGVAAKMAEWQAKYGGFDFALTRVGTGFDGYFAARPAEWEPAFRGEVSRFYRRAGQ